MNWLNISGIAADERKRIRNKCYPLVEWNMTEKDCLDYCYEKGFDWGGLYKLFHRVSCWCCPLQGLDELRQLYFNFPPLWNQLQKWDNTTWRQFRKDYSVKELAWRFEFEKEWQEQGGTLCGKLFFSQH